MRRRPGACDLFCASMLALTASSGCVFIAVSSAFPATYISANQYQHNPFTGINHSKGCVFRLTALYENRIHKIRERTENLKVLCRLVK